MSGAHPTAKKIRQCADCPATIPAYGNRKRCIDCQDKAYRKAHRRKKQTGAKP